MALKMTLEEVRRHLERKKAEAAKTGSASASRTIEKAPIFKVAEKSPTNVALNSIRSPVLVSRVASKASKAKALVPSRIEKPINDEEGQLVQNKIKVTWEGERRPSDAPGLAWGV